MYDLIIRGGTVIDGTGAQPYPAELAFRDGKIAAIGCGLSGAKQVIDATGLARDSIVDPTEGYFINLFGSISPEVLGSSDNFFRMEAKGSYHVSFFDKAITLMLGAKIGVVTGFDYHDEVPLYERYMLGGSGSVRGFEYRSIGKVVNGENIGGQTMLVLTAEISHPIWGPLRGAAFVDAGDAWSNAYSMDFADINVGVGYGLRLKLPIQSKEIAARYSFLFPLDINS